jgi:subtilase family serine protease
MEDRLLDVSNPSSKNYGKFLSKKEISEMSSNPTSFREIKQYLDFQGIEVIRTSRNNAFITAEGGLNFFLSQFCT